MRALGATCLGGGRCRFQVWAPRAESVGVRLLGPLERIVAMERSAKGYHEAVVEGVAPGACYFYRIDGEKDHPDPASHSQPQGVHEPSQVVDPDAFTWEDAGWSGLPLEEYVLYELHVGTFSSEGTFDAVIPYLDELRDLGVTAIELMPVAQFPGGRNWGYDGVLPFAVQNTYGGPEGLKKLVNACHRRAMAAVLDVVYNHMGPEGNYLGEFAPYFSERYKTPWGPAINFEGAYSDEVRRYFLENALYWMTEYHFDALRLDAIHGILDTTARPFLAELGEEVHRCARMLGRKLYLISETSLNDTRVLLPREAGGYGHDAQWNDDFHHALHTLLTGEDKGYYQDFGRLDQLAKAFREGYVYSGEYSAFRKRRHGVPSRSMPARCFVAYSQTHDYVGNREGSERLSRLVSFEALKLAAGVVLLSPFVPLLFMGEEYGETAPFHYFVSHSHADLIQAVRKGRREEFASFDWQGEPPDPQEEATFQQSKLHHERKKEGLHAALLALYRELLRLRRELPALARLNKEEMEVIPFEREKLLWLKRGRGIDEAVALFHFGKDRAAFTFPFPFPAGQWRNRLDSSDERWGGKGSSLTEILESRSSVTLRLNPESFCLFVRVGEGKT